MRQHKIFSISPWTEFDFLARCAADHVHPGSLLYLLGLWPVQADGNGNVGNDLDVSRLFVGRMLGNAVAGLTPLQRIEALRLLEPSEQQRMDLEQFLWSASTQPLMVALRDLADKPQLWVNALRLEGAALHIQSIELVPWRTSAGKVAKWSGLVEQADADDPPALRIDPRGNQTGNYAKLEVRWKVRPDNLEKGAAEYHVVILTDMDEELASQDVSHTGRKEEKCRFTNDDFSMLNEDTLVNAKVVVSVAGNDEIEPRESEEFVIKSGTPPETEGGGVGKKVRAFSEGAAELDEREMVATLASCEQPFPADKKGYVLLRTPQRGKSYRVYRPPLVRDIERQWVDRGGEVGRWTIRVRASGTRVGDPEFVPLQPRDIRPDELWASLWDRAVNASRRMADRVATCGGGVGQIYDETSKAFENVVKEYVLAWSALLEDADPCLALVNTVEVQSLSGRTLGLIVLPTHPLRAAWHTAYDNLVLHARFEQDASPNDIRKELEILDGAMFPPFLPGLTERTSFVFAHTLGFHAVGMVADDDKEPKAALAIMSRALGESEADDTSPTVGQQSAHVLGEEILKYLECHDPPRLLHLHALRPGDALTVARALGYVQQRYRPVAPEDEAGEDSGLAFVPAFLLELYPSPKQRGIAGRFIAEMRERRRTGAGRIAEEDEWMLESLSIPGGDSLPRLRWARRDQTTPQGAAHLAVAFDTFESRVVAEADAAQPPRPLYAFGLLSFFERQYSSNPTPCWRSCVPLTSEGEKHPSERSHSERLTRLLGAVLGCVVRNLAKQRGRPVLYTEISPEKEDDLREIHRLCDWVITLDRSAGIEYFDSPRDKKEIYDAYVIDCVPEREDLGCLQLIISTANLEEVRNLLDGALDQMGLSRSRRNAEFLMEHLKALSGHLAIRLTGQKAPTSELIALAMSHANCWQTADAGGCWTPLRGGFMIPVDDVRDLLPPLSSSDGQDGSKATRPDLIHVSVIPRKGLCFQFIEVKYRRHLRAARSPDVLQSIKDQVESLHERWEEWYASEDVPAVFRAVRRAKLARVLRFYADKAHRHCFPDEQYRAAVAEIDRMIDKGSGYAFAGTEGGDRGWVFCPEYNSPNPLEITPAGWDTRIFLFGPAVLPDCAWPREPIRVTGPDSVAEVARPQREPEGEPEAAGREEATESSETQRPASPAAADPPRITSADTGRADTIHGEASSETGAVASSGVPAPSVRLGTDLLTGGDVVWPLSVQGNPHLLVAGLPGMGKTTCLLNLCQQMLEAGIRPIVFSYHPDIDEKLKNMMASVRFVDFHGLAFNPLQVIDRSSRMAYLDVAGAVRDIFVAIFPELGDIQGERIRRAIKESFIENGWDDPGAGLEDLVEPAFRRFVEILNADSKPDRGLKTLRARLDELADYGFFELAEAQESLWDSDEPIVIRIHTTQNDNLQKAFASLVFYGLYKDMFCRGTRGRITHALVFDEAHRAARLRLIPTMAKECRKFGISLVLASQEARDFHISVFSAIANYLVLRLTEADAKALVRNVASSDQERMLIDKIKQMDRFKALYFREGQRKPSLVALQA